MRISTLVIFVLFCALASGARAESQEVGANDLEMLLPSSELQDQLTAAREHYLAFDLDTAEAHFYELAKEQGGEIAAYLHLTSISMYRFLMTDQNFFEEEFLQRSDSLKSLLDEVDDSNWRIFIGAEANLQRAVVRAKRGKYFRAALAARAAYGEYNRVVKRDPRFYEAYKGLGLLHLTFEYAPGFYKRFLKLLGYSSEVGQGVAELTLAAERSGYNQEEAKVILGVVDVVLYGSQREGDKLLRSLYEKHPDNPMFSHVLGYYLFANRRVDEAIDLFRDSADRFDDPDYFFIDYTDQFLATCYFYRGDYEESIFYNKRYIENHPGPAVKAPANLTVGLALELLGRRDEAIPFYLAVRSTREFDLDDVAESRANTLIERPMTSTERTMLLAENALAAGRYEKASSILIDFLQDDDLPQNDIAQATYVLARINHAEGKRAMAFEQYQRVIDMPRDNSTRWAPWAEYYRGIMFEEDDRKPLALNSFETAMEYSGDFEFRKSLHDLSTLAIKRLGE